MFSKTGMISLVAGVLMAAVGVAQTPAAAPSGSTGLCRDGSYWSGPTKKGACHGHKGVKDWYATPSSSSAVAAKAPAAAATVAAAAPAAPATAAAPVAAAPAMRTRRANSAPTVPAAPGGGAGQVWVNKTSKVYHCQSDRWYGKTKNGAYMSEADAVAQGNHPDHGKACK